MAKKNVDDCGGLKPFVRPEIKTKAKKAAATTAKKKTVKKPTKKK